jgi:hypothetical protein
MIFTVIGFEGFWPVGTSAVVIAADRKTAEVLLTAELVAHGLSGNLEGADWSVLDPSIEGAHILDDGEY